MASLSALQAERTRLCRLTPDRALESLEQAHEFLDDRGLLTRTPDSSLPSLFEAMHEEPYAPGTGGFGSWPRTNYAWSFQLGDLAGVHTAQVHRGKTVYMSAEVAALADPICRAEIARMEAADDGWARLLRHLGDAGPSLVEDIQVELELKPKELKSLRAPLERCGAIVSRMVVRSTAAGRHVHTGELARWDQVFDGDGAAEPDLGALVVAGVRAAVVVTEPEPARWFSWRWRWEAGLVDRLVEDGRLVRPEAGWLAAA